MYKKLFLYLVLAVSLAGCAIMGKRLFEAVKEYKAGSDIYDFVSSVAHKESHGLASNELSEVTETPEQISGTEILPEDYSPVDFAALLEISPDIRGWIRLEGTNVDYPVMQTNNNDFYLSHAVNGEWNKVGTPYIDFRNSGDFSDRLTVIYGHYMDDGSMFTDIHKYKSQKFYDEHPYIELYTPRESYRIIPVAGVYQNAEYWDFTFDFDSDEAFLQQIDTWKASSTFKSNNEYDAGDRFAILTLCTYDIENGRFLLVGKVDP